MREWLIANNFQGKAGQTVPAMSDAWVGEISARYVELYETVTGQAFRPADTIDPLARIEAAVTAVLGQGAVR